MSEVSYLKDKIQLSGTISNLAALMKWIIQKIEQAGFPIAESRKIQLAMEEALVNVIHYAYPNQTGLIEIHSSLIPQKIVQFEIMDEGKAFNPLEFSKTLEEGEVLLDREVGGLGIILIKKIMDEVHYERRGNSNVLIICKKISS